MNPNTILGALTDTDFMLVGMVGGKRALQSIPVPPQMSDWSTLFRHAVQAGLTSVWVMPSSRFSREATRSFIEEIDSVWEVAATYSQLDPARPLCASVWRKLRSGRQGPVLSLTFPEYGGWEWQLPDATALLATVTYVEHALGIPVNCSPEQLALDLLKGLTVDTEASWTRSPTVDLRSLPTSDGQTVPILESARPVVWTRPLSIAEWRMKYLHKYERNTLDLESCTQVQLGAGGPLYSANGRAYDGKMPGIWRVKAEAAGSIFDGKRLPSCIHGEWMSTPEVKCCTDIAYQVQVIEGYYWPESHRALERWATTLWRALQRFKQTSTAYRHAQARGNASHTIQAIMRLGIAKLVEFAPLSLPVPFAPLAREQQTGSPLPRLPLPSSPLARRQDDNASNARKQEGAPEGLFRPDWWAQIVGQSRASVFAHLVTLVRQGSMPVLVDRDALWFVSNDPNPLTAVPGLLAAEKPGGYKAAYEAPLALTGEIKEAFRTANNADQLAGMLDALATEKVA